jgi:hypothetical protein
MLAGKFKYIIAVIILAGIFIGFNTSMAQQPRDTVWVWYGDSSLAIINADIGDTLAIDVFVETAPNAYVGDMLLVLGFDRQYFDTLLSDVLGEIYPPLSEWDGAFFYPPEGSPPNPDGWMSQAMQGYAELSPPYESEYLHSEIPIKIMTMVAVTSNNPENSGQTVDALGPGLNSIQGPSNAGDTAGGAGYEVAEFFSQVRFGGADIGNISGHVQNQDGDAVANIQITVTPSGATTSTDETGDYSLALAPGGYQLTFSHPAYVDTTVTGVNVIRDQTTILDIEMRALPGGIIYGTVSDTSGILLSGIRVYDSGLLSADTTDIGGEYSLSLPQGSYTIHFDGFGYVDTVITGISINVDELLELNISLRLDPEELDQLPDKIDIRQNYPNPFNTGTIIEFALEKPLHVDIEFFDILGRRVDALDSFTASQGLNRVWWRPYDIASGIYFCRIRSNKNSEAKAMLYLK